MKTKMISKISKIFLVAVIALTLVVPAVVGARAQDDLLGVNAVGEELSLGKADIRTTIGQIINAALGFLGVVAVVIVLIGGFKYMTAGGSDEKVADARKWIISGIIGLAIILLAYAITSFVIDRLISATGAVVVD